MSEPKPWEKYKPKPWEKYGEKDSSPEEEPEGPYMAPEGSVTFTPEQRSRMEAHGIDAPEPYEPSGIDVTEDPGVWDAVRGGVEPLMTMGTGAGAMLSSGVAGVGDIVNNVIAPYARLAGFDMKDTTLEERVNMVKAIQQKYTWQPRSESAKMNLQMVGKPFEWYSENVARPTGEAYGRATDSPLVGSVVEALMEVPDIAFGMKGGGRLAANVPETASLGRKVVDKTIDIPKKATESVVNAIGHVVEPSIPGRQRRVGGRALNRTAGDRRQAVIDSMYGAKEGETMGQASIPSGSYEIPALQRRLAKEDPSRFGAIKDAQRQRRADRLTEEFGDRQKLDEANAIISDDAAKAYGGVRGDKVDPRSSEQKLIDMSNRAKERATQAEAAKVSALRDKGRMDTAEAQMETLAKGDDIPTNLAEQSIREGARYNPTGSRTATGEVLPPPRYTPQRQRAAEARSAANEFGELVEMRKLAEDTYTDISGLVLNEALHNSGVGLNTFLDRPSVKKAIKQAKKAAKETGTHWPKKGENYTVGNLQRIKREIGTVIKTRRVERKGTLDKTEEAELTSTLNSFNDFLRSRSPGYAAADDAFAAAKETVNQMDIGQFVRDKLEGVRGTDERQYAYQLAMKEADKTVKSATGMEIPMKEILSEEQFSILKEIGDEFTRDVTEKQRAGAGMYSMEQRMGSALPRAAPPGFLDRAVYVVRAVLDRLHGYGSKKTRDYILERLDNPQEIGRMMEEASPTERAVLDEWVKARNKALVSGAIAAQPQENQ